MTPLHGRASTLGRDVAARFADLVDRDGRFPEEAFDAMREARLLGAMIPPELGGEGASFKEICDICAVLGQFCGSTAMVYAMHSIQVVSLLECAMDSLWHRDFLARVARDQLLLASSTSEAGIGGDFRNSLCAVEIGAGRFSLVKQAIVISYAKSADAILVTARRNQDAPTSDQVMIVVEKGQYTLSQTGTWDTLGMRGVRSEGFLLEIGAPLCQVTPAPFGDHAAQSMLASSHLFWASLWFGMASAAFARAQAFVKDGVKRQPGSSPSTMPSGARLAQALSLLQMLKARIRDGIDLFDAARAEGDGILAMSFTIAMNNIKISASQTMLEIIQETLLICGIYGYRNDTPYSLGRLLRDALSAPVMINNDRILGNTSNLLLMHRQNTTLMS